MNLDANTGLLLAISEHLDALEGPCILLPSKGDQSSLVFLSPEENM